MSLKAQLIRQIAVDGPMSLADYMQACLLHPEFGYYATRDPLGAQGDFITAPETSQMFGELLGLCLAQAWLDQGGGDCVLAELGPGRGTLMADILRATKSVPGFAPDVHLVEASPALRDIQRATLMGARVTWHDTVADLPDAPLFLIANEFFDALPIRQFTRQGRGWAETRVGAEGDMLRLGRTEPTPVDALSHRLQDTGDGDVVELCPTLPPIIGEISGRIARHGGAALIVDYGDWNSLGDTFQALKAHQPCDPMQAPGDADLTAHVDFRAVTDASLCETSAMTTQGALLHGLGIGPRAQALAEKLDDARDQNALNQHLAAYRRLTEPSEMGTLFKAVALYPKGAPPPPGFEA
ncbi:SAM-dependent methyltransferase [uncultured Litoreibacter sp.]|uniref:class I SAM-dependent methyltransferase n=1 Tax=uncultured Litoreibacter sp. TaxID=1392394 RepID=UPI00260B740A|nr:SAM-dependent methyltransferase [uncultured Litoreibacter sp.]